MSYHGPYKIETHCEDGWRLLTTYTNLQDSLHEADYMAQLGIPARVRDHKGRVAYVALNGDDQPETKSVTDPAIGGSVTVEKA
jgi:hypothetical protein